MREGAFGPSSIVTTAKSTRKRTYDFTNFTRRHDVCLRAVSASREPYREDGKRKREIVAKLPTGRFSTLDTRSIPGGRVFQGHDRPGGSQSGKRTLRVTRVSVHNRSAAESIDLCDWSAIEKRAHAQTRPRDGGRLAHGTLQCRAAVRRSPTAAPASAGSKCPDAQLSTGGLADGVATRTARMTERTGEGSAADRECVVLRIRLRDAAKTPMPAAATCDLFFV